MVGSFLCGIFCKPLHFLIQPLHFLSQVCKVNRKKLTLHSVSVHTSQVYRLYTHYPWLLHSHHSNIQTDKICNLQSLFYPVDRYEFRVDKNCKHLLKVFLVDQLFFRTWKKKISNKKIRNLIDKIYSRQRIKTKIKKKNHLLTCHDHIYHI